MWNRPLLILVIGIVILVVLLVFKGRNLVCEATFDRSIQQHNLPTFHTMCDLKASAWYVYLTILYTDAQMEQLLPVDISKFWVLYPQYLPPPLWDSLCVSMMPRFPKDVFRAMLVFDHWDGIRVTHEHLMHQWDVLFIYQYDRIPNHPCDTDIWHKTIWDIPLPIAAAKSFELVEVMRFPDQLGSFHWFYYGKGSGIWIDVGKTIWFRDHQDAYTYFCIDAYLDGAHTQQDEELLAAALLTNGYDTIQFLCAAENIYKYEIMTVHSRQNAQGSACVNIPTWGRGMVPCMCETGPWIINCQLHTHKKYDNHCESVG